jgi:hypothetical protein
MDNVSGWDKKKALSSGVTGNIKPAREIPEAVPVDGV